MMLMQMALHCNSYMPSVGMPPVADRTVHKHHAVQFASQHSCGSHQLVQLGLGMPCPYAPASARDIGPESSR